MGDVSKERTVIYVFCKGIWKASCAAGFAKQGPGLPPAPGECSVQRVGKRCKVGPAFNPIGVPWGQAAWHLYPDSESALKPFKRRGDADCKSALLSAGRGLLPPGAVRQPATRSNGCGRTNTGPRTNQLFPFPFIVQLTPYTPLPAARGRPPGLPPRPGGPSTASGRRAALLRP